jgi:hypothetical protein
MTTLGNISYKIDDASGICYATATEKQLAGLAKGIAKQAKVSRATARTYVLASITEQGLKFGAKRVILQLVA